MKSSVLVMSLFFLFGCASTSNVPELSMAEGSLNPHEVWKEILASYVDQKGKVDFGSLKENPMKLRHYLNYIAKNSPTTTPEKFPTVDSKLAFYINSYNALAMYAMLDGEIPQHLKTSQLQAKYFYFKKFVVGDQVMSLYQYENDVIRREGEDKVHFALNCMATGSPKLPNYPFPVKGLTAELEKQAKIFFNDSQNVQIDSVAKTVRLSEIMKWYAEDFLKKAPSIIAYVNQFRTEKIQANYKVEYIPFDWTVNRVIRGTASRMEMHTESAPTTN